MPHRVTGEVLGFGKRQERGENIRLEPLLGFPWGEEGRASGEGRVSSLDLASLNTFGGFGVVPGCLVPGPGGGKG